MRAATLLAACAAAAAAPFDGDTAPLRHAASPADARAGLQRRADALRSLLWQAHRGDDHPTPGVHAALRVSAALANDGAALNALDASLGPGWDAGADRWVDTHGDVAVLAGPGGARMVEVHLDEQLYAAVTSPEALAGLASAARVPLSGFVLDGVFVFDPAFMPARCEAEGEGERGACAVGGRIAKGVTRPEAAAAARAEWAAAIVGAAGKFTRLSLSATGDDGLGLYMAAPPPRAAPAPSSASGQSVLVLRVAWADTPSEGAVPATAAAELCARVSEFLGGADAAGSLAGGEGSGGAAAVTTVACPSSCLYTLPGVSQEDAEEAPLSALASEAVRQAASASVGSCVLSHPDGGRYAHVMLLLPAPADDVEGVPFVSMHPGSYS